VEEVGKGVCLSGSGRETNLGMGMGRSMSGSAAPSAAATCGWMCAIEGEKALWGALVRDMGREGWTDRSIGQNVLKSHLC
jgi:hypothetical protein